MAVTESPTAEYAALTEGAGLVDRSERGKLALTGSGAAEFLNGQVTNDVEALAPGEGLYAAFLTHKGKMLGDMRVLDVGHELLLDTERVALQELFNMIRRYKLGRDVELHKRTLETAVLSLIGPDARRSAGAEDLVEEHRNRHAEIAGVPVVLVATDVGIDVFAPAESRETVIAELGELPIKSVGGAMVYVRDVANVRDGNPPQNNIVHVEGSRSVLMQVLKNGSVSTLAIIEGIKQKVELLKSLVPPSLNIQLIGDQSLFVKAAIGGVVKEGILAAALTSLMILVFLGSWRSTVIRSSTCRREANASPQRRQWACSACPPTSL